MAIIEGKYVLISLHIAFHLLIIERALKRITVLWISVVAFAFTRLNFDK